MVRPGFLKEGKRLLDVLPRGLLRHRNPTGAFREVVKELRFRVIPGLRHHGPIRPQNGDLSDSAEPRELHALGHSTDEPF